MNRLLSLILYAFVIFAFPFCTKSSSTPTPTYPIVGLWIGTAKVNGQSADSVYFSLDIRSDSSLLVQGQGGDGNTYYGAGRWSLSGTSLTGSTTILNLSQAGVVQTITAVYNNTGVLVGTWQNNSSTSGTFVLQRVD